MIVSFPGCDSNGCVQQEKQIIKRAENPFLTMDNFDGLEIEGEYHIVRLTCLCEALCVSEALVEEVKAVPFDVIADSAMESGEVSLVVDEDADMVVLFAVTGDDAYDICSLCPQEEGELWPWVYEWLIRALGSAFEGAGIRVNVDDPKGFVFNSIR